MVALPRLNRRHKAALFLSILAAGLSLVLGASVKQAVGIVLLGLAVAWAFGSDCRVVHWLPVGLGLVLTFGAVGLFYSEADREAWAAYNDIRGNRALALQILRDPNWRKDPFAGKPPYEGLMRLTREQLQDYIREAMPEEPDQTVDKFLVTYPAWKAFLVEHLEEPPSGMVIYYFMLHNRIFVLPGILLLGVGLCLIFGVRRQPRQS